MLELLNTLDTQLFLFLNGLHHPLIDPVMIFVSGKLSWIPLYAFLLIVLIRKYKWQTIMLLLVISILITLSDQLSVKAFKLVFERPRPCHEADLQTLIHLPSGRCGGAFGFVSSHAANSFAMAGFVYFLLRHWFRPIGYIAFGWAALVSYSRIYLGVHYPGDVVFGALLGLVVAFAVYQVFRLADQYVCRTNC
jgi:undecaprenyl-diphosphatase